MNTNDLQLWIIGLLLLSSFSSCQEAQNFNSENTIPVISEVDKGNYSILNLSDFASEITYIPLETNDATLISEIKTIIYENEKILIFNEKTMTTDYDKCMIFNKNGGFFKQLGRRGQGPNEYFRIDQIFTDKDYVYVREQPNFLMRYDFDGNLVKKISAPKGEREKNQFLLFSFFQPLKKDIFVFDVNSWKEKYPIAMLVAEIDTGSTVIKEYPIEVELKKATKNRSTFENAIMYRYKDEVRLYKRVINDTVYTIGQDLEMREGFVFDFGKYNIPIAWFEDYRIMPQMEAYIYVTSILESTTHLFFIFQFGDQCPEPFEYTVINEITGKEMIVINKRVYGVYDKNAAKLTLMRQPVKTKLGFKNDMDEGPIFWPHYISSKNELVTYISAEDFLKHVANLKNPSPKLAELAKRVLPDDNPIVIIAKLK